MSRPRDSQLSRVGRFHWTLERELAKDSEPMTLEAATDLVADVFARYAMEPPAVRHRYNGRRTYATTSRIELPPSGRTTVTILHECAHTITDRVLRNSRELPAHGPEFMRTCVELLVLFAGVSRKRLSALAKKERVRVARGVPGLRPPLLRDARAWRTLNDSIRTVNARISRLQEERSALRAEEREMRTTMRTR